MQPAKDELQAAIEATTFSTPRIPVYQNVDAKAHTDAEEIKQNLIAQLTAPVKWTYEVQQMLTADDAEARLGALARRLGVAATVRITARRRVEHLTFPYTKPIKQ